MKRRRPGSRGFTLAEVLVAVAMLGLVLAGVGMMAATTMTADGNSRRISAATALALAKLEELRALPRTHADWGAGGHSESGVREDGTAGGGPYRREWDVELDYNGYASLHRVTATVSHDAAGLSVSMASLYWW